MGWGGCMYAVVGGLWLGEGIVYYRIGEWGVFIKSGEGRVFSGVASVADGCQKHRCS